jgi:hypothetical protein
MPALQVGNPMVPQCSGPIGDAGSWFHAMVCAWAGLENNPDAASGSETTPIAAAEGRIIECRGQDHRVLARPVLRLISDPAGTIWDVIALFELFLPAPAAAPGRPCRHCPGRRGTRRRQCPLRGRSVRARHRRSGQLWVCRSLIFAQAGVGSGMTSLGRHGARALTIGRRCA